MGEGPFKEMTGDKVEEILKNNENKFIYFYRKSSLDLEEYKKVTEFAGKISHGMKVVPYKIDLDAHYEPLVKYLKERNPSSA